MDSLLYCGYHKDTRTATDLDYSAASEYEQSDWSANQALTARRATQKIRSI